MNISIKDGVVTGFSDELAIIDKSLEITQTKRVSNIYPVNKFYRVFFKVIRFCVNDNSKIAKWTRTWNCNWTVNYKNKVYGNFTKRDDAIKYEKEIVWNDMKEKR